MRTKPNLESRDWSKSVGKTLAEVQARKELIRGAFRVDVEAHEAEKRLVDYYPEHMGAAILASRQERARLMRKRAKVDYNNIE